MKGVSTVIATLLLLVITMALATLAFTYLQGAITSRTDVVLEMNLKGQKCIGNIIAVSVDNSGTLSAGTVQVAARDSSGQVAGKCSVTVSAQSSGTCEITRLVDSPSNEYSLLATGGGDTTTGSVFCRGLISFLSGSWRFDEGAGSTAADSSENGNSGTLANGPVWVDGKYGKALQFDGADDVVNIPSSASLDSPATTGALTMTLWIRRPPGSSGYVQFSKWGAYEIRVEGGNFYGVINTAVDEQAVYTPLTPAVGVWYNLAFTYDRQNMILYINGEPVATRAETKAIRTSTNYLRIGRNDGGGSGDSIHDEPRVYNRALSADEIRTLYSG